MTLLSIGVLIALKIMYLASPKRHGSLMEITCIYITTYLGGTYT